MIPKVTLIFLIVINVAAKAVCQPFSFSSYDISDGLSQSVVNCIFQDSRGFIWIGTQNGLNRFDGYNFKVYTYKPGDTTSISNNWIFGIAEDKAGNLWIGTKSGLNKYFRNEDRFDRIRYNTPYKSDITTCVYDIKCSGDGLIMINTPPVLTLLNPENGKCSHKVVPLEFDGSVKDNTIPVLQDQQGNIWTGSTRGLSCYSTYTGKIRVFVHDPQNPRSLSDNTVTALFQDVAGNLWVGTAHGLNLLDPNWKGFERYYSGTGEQSLPNDYIRAVLGDRFGNIWIGMEGGGLSRLRYKAKDEPVFENFTTGKHNLNHSIVLSLCIDQSENLWIGTLSGINRTDLKKTKFRLYRRSDAPGSIDLSGNVIASVYKDLFNVLWIGTWGQGLNLYDRKTGKIEHYSTQAGGKYHLPNDYIHTIFVDHNHRLWLGTRDGLLVYRPKEHDFMRPSSLYPGSGLENLEGLRINMMLQDRNGSYWIATQNGLFRMKQGLLKAEHFQKDAGPQRKISSNLVYALLEDHTGKIWIGTVDGLDVYDPATSEFNHFRKSGGKGTTLSDNFITALYEDLSGNIWIGTNSYVNRYSPKNKVFTYFSQEQGLPGNLIYSILEDNRHNLWFATGNGLCKYAEATGSFRSFSVEEGLQSPEFNLRASYKSPDGEMFFGGMNGLNSFFPDSLADNPHIPLMAFTSAYLVRKGIREYIDPDRTGRMVLNYNDYSFTIEFAALEFTNPEKNRYAYKLEGVDEDWIDIGTRNFVAFSSLPPGEYLLRVKGSNNDGIWNTAGISLMITIRPPWWRSTLAYIAYVVFLALLVWLIIIIRERQHIHARKVLEKKVQERTLQIESQKQEIEVKNTELSELNATKDRFFSIIGHDLRNPFNAITGLTDLLLMGMFDEDPEKGRKSLENIRGASQQAHELLENLLLWARSHTGTIAFQPEPLDLKAMVEENIRLVEVIAARKNITITTRFNHCHPVNGDRNMIHTVLRNLITNALKFTPHGGEVTISMMHENHSCILTIRDTGVGIPEGRLKELFDIGTIHKTKGTDQEPGTGLGLILCKEFVEKHSGRLEVESEPGRGSTFRVVFQHVIRSLE